MILKGQSVIFKNCLNIYKKGQKVHYLSDQSKVEGRFILGQKSWLTLPTVHFKSWAVRHRPVSCINSSYILSDRPHKNVLGLKAKLAQRSSKEFLKWGPKMTGTPFSRPICRLCWCRCYGVHSKELCFVKIEYLWRN